MKRMFWIVVLSAIAAGTAHADFLDEFNSFVLDPGWRVLYEDSANWSLERRPGSLRIESQYFYSLPINFFCHIEAINGDFKASTCLIAHPDSSGQVALMNADYDSLFVTPQAMIGFGNLSGIGKVVFTVFNDTILDGMVYDDTLVYLRIRTHSDTVFGEYSANNTDWVAVGSYYSPHYDQVQTTGLMAVNHALLGATPQTPEMNADFDWFHLVALTGAEEGAASIPDMQNSMSATPNPFRARTDIRYKIHDARCKNRMLKIFDATGRLVKQFNRLSATQYGGIQPFDQITWPGDDQNGVQVPAGVYFVRQINGGAASLRIVKIE